MAVTEVQAGTRYVVGPNPTNHNGVGASFFNEGDVVTLAPGYGTLPDGDGDVRMRTDAHSEVGHYLAIKHLTEQADDAPAATTPEREPGVLLVGDKVKLKAEQSPALPGSLRDYLDANGLTTEAAVFTVSASGGRVEFSEYDTLGGYYPSRFELVAPADTPAAEQLVDVDTPAAEQLTPVDSISDLSVGDVLVVSDGVPASADIPAGTRLRVTSVGGTLFYAMRLDNSVTRTVRDTQLRYVSKVVTTDTTEVAAEPTPAEPVAPVVGGRVKFLTAYVQGAEAAVGDEFEILVVNAAGAAVTTKNPYEGGTWYFRLTGEDGLEVLPPPPVITADHEADLAKIAAALLSEATTRGGRWPGVYDELVATLNPQLTVKLPERERPISVDLGSVLGIVTVQARNLDEAKQKVLEAARSAISSLS